MGAPPHVATHTTKSMSLKPDMLHTIHSTIIAYWRLYAFSIGPSMSFQRAKEVRPLADNGGWSVNQLTKEC